MLAFVLLSFLCVDVSAGLAPMRVSSYSGEYGGSTGYPFNQSRNQLDGPITALRIRADDRYILSIQVCYGDSWSGTEGSTTGNPFNVQLFPGEGFVQVLGRFGGHVEYLAFRTNLHRVFAFGPNSGLGMTFDAEPLFSNTVLRYISGRSGSLVDAIEFHWDKSINIWTHESSGGRRSLKGKVKVKMERKLEGQLKQTFKATIAMGEGDPGEVERFLQKVYQDQVFLLGDKDWRVGKNFFIVKSTVEKVVKWAFESSTGLYPKDPIPVGSYQEGLHLQMEGSSNNFDFLIPLRFNPKLALTSGGIAKEVSSYEQKLPTYIFREEGVPVSRWGTKILVDLEAVGETYVKVYCEKEETGLEDDDYDFTFDKLKECQESLQHHNLDPVEILKDFYRYVEIALDPAYTHPRQNDPVFQRRLFPSRVPKIDNRIRQNIKLEALDLEGPAIQLTFHEGTDVVPVNLIPAIQGALKLSNQCLREDLTHLSDWWVGDLTNEKKSFLRKVAALQEAGPELVSKGGYWRLSFRLAETVILGDTEADGGQRRAALKLLKFVNETRWIPEYGNILTSYHLKTILLWCCEIYPQKAQWETLQRSLQALLCVLNYTLIKKNLPHYFLRPVNLFGKCYRSSNASYRLLSLDALHWEVEVMLANIVRYLMPDSKPQGGCAHDELEEKRAALQVFKEKHQEELKELKRMEDEHMYEEVETGEEDSPKSCTEN